MSDLVENDVIEHHIDNKKYVFSYDDGEYAICCTETDKNGKETVYISQLSAATLHKRSEDIL